MTDQEKINELRQSVVVLLEALDFSTPENCDCGGLDFCACCDAYVALEETK